MPLELPKEKNLAVTDLSKFKILIYGNPKIGKSTFCSKLDSPLFLATESGLGSLDTYDQAITSWKEFTGYCGLIAKGNHDYKTIVIDTIDNLIMLCTSHVCKKHGISHISELENSKGYSIVNTELLRVLSKLASLPYGLILISHAQQIQVNERTGKYQRMTATMTAKQNKIVFGFVDMILYFDTIIKTIDDEEKEIRVIRTKPSKFYEAGDRTGKLPEIIKLSVGAFKRAFEKSMKRENAESKTEEKQTDKK